jgi:hypothetical protein
MLRWGIICLWRRKLVKLKSKLWQLGYKLKSELLLSYFDPHRIRAKEHRWGRRVCKQTLGKTILESKYSFLNIVILTDLCASFIVLVLSVPLFRIHIIIFSYIDTSGVAQHLVIKSNTEVLPLRIFKVACFETIWENVRNV